MKRILKSLVVELDEVHNQLVLILSNKVVIRTNVLEMMTRLYFDLHVERMMMGILFLFDQKMLELMMREENLLNLLVPTQLLRNVILEILHKVHLITPTTGKAQMRVNILQIQYVEMG